ARSSGSTTPRGTDSSNATEAVMSSSITRLSRVTGSVRSRKARPWSSRSLTARRARRLATSRKSNLLVGQRDKGFSSSLCPLPSALIARTLHRPRRKAHFPILHRNAKRHLGVFSVAQLAHLPLHQIGEL